MQKIRCEVCGSENIVKNGKVFVCLNCGCKYFPDSDYELSYLQEEDAPSIEEILAHKGLNPVNVTKKNGVIRIIDEYTGKSYTAEQYRAHIYGLTHRPSFFRRMWDRITDTFTSFDWDLESIAKIILIVLIPLFLIIGVLSIRNQAPFGLILFQILIAVSAAIHLGAYISESIDDRDYILTLVNCGLQIALNHFIIFGSLFSLEFIWRLIIGVILKITFYWITYYIIDN